MYSRSCRERRAVGREHSPEELQCWWCGCWMCIFQASLSAACLLGSWWSLTDGGGYRELCQFILKGVRDDGVESGAEVHKQDPCMVCPDVGGWSAIACWLHHPQTCLLGKQTAGGPARFQYCPSGGPTRASQMTSSPQMLKQQVCSH